MPRRLDREALLKKLPPITAEAAETAEQDELEQVEMAPSLLTLAELNHQGEYDLACAVALHFLGHVPAPDDSDLRDD